MAASSARYIRIRSVNQWLNAKATRVLPIRNAMQAGVLNVLDKMVGTRHHPEQRDTGVTATRTTRARYGPSLSLSLSLSLSSPSLSIPWARRPTYSASMPRMRCASTRPHLGKTFGIKDRYVWVTENGTFQSMCTHTRLHTHRVLCRECLILIRSLRAGIAAPARRRRLTISRRNLRQQPARRALLSNWVGEPGSGSDGQSAAIGIVRNTEIDAGEIVFPYDFASFLCPHAVARRPERIRRQSGRMSRHSMLTLSCYSSQANKRACSGCQHSPTQCIGGEHAAGVWADLVFDTRRLGD